MKLHKGVSSVMKATGKLNAAKRNALPKSEFGMPGERKYPVNDKKHAVLAKGRAAEMVNKGKLSSATAAKIKSKANRVLGR